MFWLVFCVNVSDLLHVIREVFKLIPMYRNMVGDNKQEAVMSSVKSGKSYWCLVNLI
jgi:hypothetical protein